MELKKVFQFVSSEVSKRKAAYWKQYVANLQSLFIEFMDAALTK